VLVVLLTPNLVTSEPEAVADNSNQKIVKLRPAEIYEMSIKKGIPSDIPEVGYTYNKYAELTFEDNNRGKYPRNSTWLRYISPNILYSCSFNR
jgi:hypothetical protein